MLWPAQPRLVSLSSTTSGVSIVVVSVTGGSPLDRLHDIDVPGATADVSLDRLPDLVLARARIPVEQVLGGHQDSRRAVAALQGMFVAEGLLEGVELPILSQALDGL